MVALSDRCELCAKKARILVADDRTMAQLCHDHVAELKIKLAHRVETGQPVAKVEYCDK